MIEFWSTWGELTLQKKTEPMRLNCFWMHATYRQVRLSGGFTIFQYIPGNLRLTNYPVICPKNKWLHSRKAKPKKRYWNPRRNLRCFRIEFSRLFCSNIALPWNSQLFHLERKSKKWCLRKQGQPQECRRFKTETLGRIPTFFSTVEKLSCTIFACYFIMSADNNRSMIW